MNRAFYICASTVLASSFAVADPADHDMVEFQLFKPMVEFGAEGSSALKPKDEKVGEDLNIGESHGALVYPVFGAMAGDEKQPTVLQALGAVNVSQHRLMTQSGDVELQKTGVGIGFVYGAEAGRYYMLGVGGGTAAAKDLERRASASAGAIALASHRSRPGLIWTYGAAYGRGPLGEGLLPMIGWVLSGDGKWTYSALLPLSINANYAMSLFSHISLFLKLGGGQFQVNGADEDSSLAYGYLKTGAGWSRSWGTGWKGQLESSLLLGPRTTLRSGRQVDEVTEYKPGMALKASIAYTFGSRVRAVDDGAPAGTKVTVKQVPDAKNDRLDWYEVTFPFDGLTRRALVSVPKQRSKPTPAVLLLHGGGGNATSMREVTGFDKTAAKHGVVAVYPEGYAEVALGRGKRLGTWNSGDCCGDAKAKKIDDVGFLSHLITVLTDKLAVDPARVYASGLSNGSMMSYRLACELSDRIAAIAPAGAQPATNDMTRCKPKRAVPTLIIHGTSDLCAKFKGGPCGGCVEDFLERCMLMPVTGKTTWSCDAVPTAADQWSRKMGCKGAPKKTTIGKADCLAYTGCDGPVTLCALKGMGHQWPSSEPVAFCRPGSPAANPILCGCWRHYVDGKGSKAIDNDAVWAFFAKHVLPR